MDMWNEKNETEYADICKYSKWSAYVLMCVEITYESPPFVIYFNLNIFHSVCVCFISLC